MTHYIFFLYIHIFIEQLKKIQNSNSRFRSLSGDMMTGFVQAAVFGAGVEGAHITSNVYRIIDA